MDNTNLNIADLVNKTLLVSDSAKKKSLIKCANWIDQLCALVNVIPLVGGAFAEEIHSLVNAASSYQASEFLRKFTRFIYELDDFSDEEKRNFLYEVEKTAGDSSGNVMLSIIDGMDNINKQKILANLVKAKVRKQISIENFFRLASVLRRIPYVDLTKLELYQEEYYDENGDTELLNSTGVLRPAKYNVEGDKYVLSPLGVLLMKWGCGKDVNQTSVKGTSTVEVSPIPMDVLDGILKM